MKKMILSLVAAIVCATATFAQSSMLATLSHEGTITTYYGALALKEACAAAVSGDVITLSSGSFNAVDIKKGITIRGAGMGIDASSQTDPTVLTGDFSINIPNEDTGRLTIEGIYHNATIWIYNFKNGTFIKDRFRALKQSTSGSCCVNLTMINCKVAECLVLPSNSPISCVNCVVVEPINGDSSGIEFVNCIVKDGEYSSNDLGYLRCCSFKNCILDESYSKATYFQNSSNHTVYNCIGIGASGLFKNIPNNTNVYKSYEEVFKTYKGIFNDDETFELVDSIKESIKSIDGTEVGIYGGNMPFSSTPTNPQITKCNVAAKSTADGKLSVDITVNGAE